MAMHHNAVAMADGGGGSIEWDTLLDMNTVLNSAEPEISARVLYADTIDVGAVTNVINTLSAISGEGGLGGTTSTLITDNDSLMAASNSPRFYTGDAAKAQFQSMADVYAKLATMLGDIDTIVENQSAIIEKINTYNANLKEWKKNCRIELLRKAADAWNNGKHDKDGSPERKTRSGYNPPGPKYEAGWSNDVIMEEAVKIRNYTKEEYPASSYCRGETIEVTYVEYDWHKYKIIKYWAGLKCISWFKDPGFEEVEKMLDEVGAKLPYDPALILPKE